MFTVFGVKVWFENNSFSIQTCIQTIKHHELITKQCSLSKSNSLWACIAKARA